MSNIDYIFDPEYGTGETVTTGATPSTVPVPQRTASVQFTNLGSETVWVRMQVEPGGEPAEARANLDSPVLAGTQIVLAKTREVSRVSVVSAAAGSIHVIAGNGF